MADASRRKTATRQQEWSLSDVHVPIRAPGPSPPAKIPGARESRLSRYCLAWLPVAPLVGFALAGRVFHLGEDSGHWQLWKAVVLGGVMMVPFAVGVYLGLRSVVKGFRGGWFGLVANLGLAALAIGMPLGESLTG